MRIWELQEEVEPEEDAPEDSGEAPEEYSDTAIIKAEIFPFLQKEIDKLNKKSAKFGSPPITLTKTKEFLEPIPGSPKKELVFEVKIEGKTLKLEGYKFIATIEHKAAGNIIRCVPGQEETPQIRAFYEAHPEYCDHCKKRRHRIDTYIVQAPDGELRQFGRACLGDIFKSTNPKEILWYFSILDHIRQAVKKATVKGGKLAKGGTNWGHLEPKDILASGAAVVRKYGYKKSSAGFAGSTSHMVRLGLHMSAPKTYEEEEWKDAAEHPTTADQQMADDILKWWDTIPETEKEHNNFYHSIDIVLKSGKVPSKDLGFIVAMLPSYYRAKPKSVATGPAKSNEWVGTLGAKIPSTPVKVLRTKIINGPYGRSQIVNMEDDKGNIIAWFNNGELKNDGDNFVINGTVKDQTVFNGRKQTMLTRVKVS